MESIYLVTKNNEDFLPKPKLDVSYKYLGTALTNFIIWWLINEFTLSDIIVENYPIMGFVFKRVIKLVFIYSIKLVIDGKTVNLLHVLHKGDASLKCRFKLSLYIIMVILNILNCFESGFKSCLPSYRKVFSGNVSFLFSRKFVPLYLPFDCFQFIP